MENGMQNAIFSKFSVSYFTILLYCGISHGEIVFYIVKFSDKEHKTWAWVDVLFSILLAHVTKYKFS